MSKKDEDDARAFAEAVRGAKPLDAHERGRVPLSPERRRGEPPRHAGGPTSAEATDANTFLDPTAALTDGTSFQVVTTGDAIEARAPGMDAKRLRRLKTGDPRAEARLDLHGRSRDEALTALERFVAGAREQGRRCVLVIHGRGAHSSDEAPVLKPLVWRWLAASSLSASAVLGFASAPQSEGGDGATRLLLRKIGR